MMLPRHYSTRPLKYVDPTGHWFESPWDWFSLSTGAISLVSSIRHGDILGAVIDGLGIVADTAALIVPGLPGGAGAGIKAIRGTRIVVDVADVVGGVREIKQGIEDGDGLQIAVGTLQTIAGVGGFVKGAEVAEACSDINRNVDKLVEGTRKLPQSQIDEITFDAIKGRDGADSVMLGKWMEDSPASYNKMAEAYDSQYFELDNFRELKEVYKMTDDEIFEINRRFLEIQTSSGRDILLSHNPDTFLGDGSFYSREIQFLVDSGYNFVKEGDIWRAIIK